MYKSNRLFDEFVDIERDISTGKVDHTPNFHGSQFFPVHTLSTISF